MVLVTNDKTNKQKHIDEFYPEPSKKACSGCNYRERDVPIKYRKETVKLTVSFKVSILQKSE
ncbi:hypothetical protein, partial [Paenibacillus elgii]|uniref:hypothetical protein n=1 Tax=Paenibacillus elgii TaxID=189691 RepID=UPI000248C7C3